MFRAVDYEGRIKAELNNMLNSDISDGNKRLIMDYYEYFRLQGISLPRLHRELQSLRQICQNFRDVLNGSLKDLDEATARKLAIAIESFKPKRGKDGIATRNEYKKALRRLNTWLGKEELNKYFKVRDKVDNELTADDLITADDFFKLLKACRRVRDSALIAMHYDLGCRPEELLTLQLKHIRRDDLGIKVNIHQSKTFTRAPRLTFSIPYVLEWLEAHPARDDPDAPLWIDLNAHRAGKIKHITEEAYYQILQRLKERAGLKKRIFHYLFRHTSITGRGKVLTDLQLCRRHGLVPGSRWLKRYAKLRDDDADIYLLQHYGLVKEKKEEEDPLKPKQCYNCGMVNRADAVRCRWCGVALDIKFIELDKEAEDIVIEKLLGSNLEKNTRRKAGKIG
ncbi:tyrosine-type recombinase/integrase [Archaeoglobus sulfaticallidus]|nr:tyrosine-type recombinase/integrase [Archaeoglobus sulfaticallidus]